MKETGFNKDTIKTALETYSDMVYRICFLYLNNRTDFDDVFQEVFLKLLKRNTPFESREHEKAWLIRVTINLCKDISKSFWRKKIDLVEEITFPSFESESDGELLQVVLSLPQKYKDVLYLYYYEEYTVPQMAKILKTNENTLYSQLHRAKELLKQKLEGKAYEF